MKRSVSPPRRFTADLKSGKDWVRGETMTSKIVAVLSAAALITGLLNAAAESSYIYPSQRLYLAGDDEKVLSVRVTVKRN